MALAPVDAWRSNHGHRDLSRTRFADSFTRDLLEPLPAHAILLTNGDNDTLPLWYLQQVEGVRRDVTVVSLPLSSTGSYVTQLRRGDPDLATLLGGEPLPVVLKPRPARGPVTTVVEPRTGLGLPAGARAPEIVRFQPAGLLYGQDLVALDLMRLTRWRRPVYMACTVSTEYMPWLWPYARLDGLAWRVVPSTDPSVHDVDHMREQLLEHVSYAGVADTTIVMDVDSRAMCTNYLAGLVQLALAESRRGRPDDALATLRFIDVHTPPARLGWDAGQIDMMRTQFEAEAAKAGTGSSH
jgi:hypothetical protein